MKKVKLYTPEEADIFFNYFKDAICSKDSTDCYKSIGFILRNKEKFSDDCKNEMIYISEYYISEYYIENFKEDGLKNTINYVKLLRRFVREVKNV